MFNSLALFSQKPPALKSNNVRKLAMDPELTLCGSCATTVPQNPGLPRKVTVVAQEVAKNYTRRQKINANFFCTKFDKNPSGQGRPHQKSWTSAPKSMFSCSPGEKLFEPWASGRKGREYPWKIRPEKLMFISFSSLTHKIP